MKKLLPIAVLVALLLVAAGFYVFRAGDEAPSTALIPDLTLQSHAGETVSLRDLQGTPLVVNAWATWCTFCKEELPDLQVLQEEFGDEVLVVAINRGESLEKAEAFTREYGVGDSLFFLLDPEDSFYKSIDGFTMPETVFVNSDGQIVIHKRGFMRIDELREKTRQIANNV